MVSVVHVSMFVHTTAPRSICLFGVCSRCPSVLTWTNLRACGCLLAPLSGITLTTRVMRSQHYTLFNSYKLVRPPRLLCSCRPQHESHMVQRLQVLSCPEATHSADHPQVQMDPTRTITSDLLSATLAEAATQLSFAAFLERCIFVNASPPPHQSPLHLWMSLRRLFHTPLPLGTFLRNSHSGSSWLHLLRMMFSAPRVLDESLRYFLMRLCRRLYTASQLMMPPHNYRSRSSHRVHLLQ